MYFKKNKFYHGIVFHHFHDGKFHKKSQGSISKDDFYKIIKFIGLNNILNADEFFLRFKENKLVEKNVCLTFDDAIKCQVDIALPILEDLKIKSFFFVYSSIFDGEPDFIEVYRHFRSNYFKNIEEFYTEFYKFIDQNVNHFLEKNKEKIKPIKEMYPFYSADDIKFRMVRNRFLNKEEYKNTMFKIFKKKNYNPNNFINNLFFNKQDLLKLKSLGHTIGLHTHSHPTHIEDLSNQEIENEYLKNRDVLSEILKTDKSEINSMSHPCGSYNNYCLSFLKKLKIEIGFRDNMICDTQKGMKSINNSNLEIARQDHSKIIKMIN